METLARVIEEAEPVTGGSCCQVCGKPIRSDGPGTRPAYCPGRACSSKAYRARRKAAQAAALAAAVDDSREPSSVLESEAAREIARLGNLVSRTAQRLADDLDRGADPETGAAHARLALRAAASGLERSVEALLARARAEVRSAEAGLDTSREPSRAAAGPVVPGPSRTPEHTPASPDPAGRNTALLPPADTSREPSGAAPDVSTSLPGPVVDRSREAVGTAGTAGGAAFVLGARTRVQVPTEAVFGPAHRAPFDGGLVVLVWAGYPLVQAVEHAGRPGTTVGWVQVVEHDDGQHWAATVGDRLVFTADGAAHLTDTPEAALHALRQLLPAQPGG